MAGVRMERLSAYLAASARRPIDYAAGWDCAAGFVAGWIEQERGVDAAKAWRGLYASADECQALVKASGGLMAVVERCVRTAGLIETASPAPGDIGVVSALTPDGSNQVAAIRTKIGWACLTPRGIGVFSAPSLMAWEV
jgi:hypothetical protein